MGKRWFGQLLVSSSTHHGVAGGEAGLPSMSTYSVGRLNERVVDSNDLDIGVLDSVAEDDTADTTKSVDADLDHLD